MVIVAVVIVVITLDSVIVAAVVLTRLLQRMLSLVFDGNWWGVDVSFVAARSVVLGGHLIASAPSELKLSGRRSIFD